MPDKKSVPLFKLHDLWVSCTVHNDTIVLNENSALGGKSKVA